MNFTRSGILLFIAKKYAGSRAEDPAETEVMLDFLLFFALADSSELDPDLSPDDLSKYSYNLSMPLKRFDDFYTLGISIAYHKENMRGHVLKNPLIQNWCTK